MDLWRLSKFVDLSGRGGLVASGRWHTHPKSIVYSAGDAKTAYSEILRQVGIPALLPEDYKLLRLNVPDSVKIETVDLETLDPAWSDDTIGWRICRPIGDAWIRSCRTGLLKVPSAARPGHWNFLINPAARDADDITVSDIIEQPFPGFDDTA